MPRRFPDAAAFAREVEWHRRSKDEALRSEPWSPIPGGERRAFAGLAYFDPDPAWAVPARLTRLPGSAPFEMQASTGPPRLQVRAARLDFETPAGPAALFAYKDAARPRSPSLFVPFRDATSGKDTYGAGRYLDLEEPEADELVVDFNQAYNPYCAYSEAYSCPLPPAENWLKIAVTAGEKSYHP
jgi:uncharacterized protein (DUF1684 family)